MNKRQEESLENQQIEDQITSMLNKVLDDDSDPESKKELHMRSCNAQFDYNSVNAPILLINNEPYLKRHSVDERILNNPLNFSRTEKRPNTINYIGQVTSPRLIIQNNNFNISDQNNVNLYFSNVTSNNGRSTPKANLDNYNSYSTNTR